MPRCSFALEAKQPRAHRLLNGSIDTLFCKREWLGVSVPLLTKLFFLFFWLGECVIANGFSRPLDKFAYPLKPSYASEPSHIQLRGVDAWTRIMIEIGKSLIRPEGSEFALAI